MHILATYIYISTGDSLTLNAFLSSLCLGTAKKSHKSRQRAAILEHSRQLMGPFQPELLHLQVLSFTSNTTSVLSHRTSGSYDSLKYLCSVAVTSLTALLQGEKQKKGKKEIGEAVLADFKARQNTIIQENSDFGVQTHMHMLLNLSSVMKLVFMNRCHSYIIAC